MTKAKPKPVRHAGGATEPRVSGDTIASWLDALERLLPGAEPERRETRVELETHLRDRARDLMLAGLNADEAARRAIDELGEASDVASSFRATRADTHRRRIMHGTGIGLAAGAAVVSIAAIFQGAASSTGQPSGSTPPMARPSMVSPTLVYSDRLEKPVILGAGVQGEQAALTITPEELERVGLRLGHHYEVVANPEDGVVTLIGSEASALRPPSVSTYMGDEIPSAVAPYTMSAEFVDAPVQRVIEAMAKACGKPVVIPWAQLEADFAHALNDARVTFTGKDLSLDEYLARVNLVLQDAAGRLVARPAPNGAIEIAPQDTFDRREIRLTAYDVADLLATAFGGERSESARAARLEQTISQVVFPEDWRENGGTLAQMHYAGGVLFVNAPARHHAKLEWILSRIVESAGVAR